MQIDKLEAEQEIPAVELDSLRDDIRCDRITMNREDCLARDRDHFFQRRMLTEYAGNVYWKLPESTVMELDFGAMFSGVS